MDKHICLFYLSDKLTVDQMQEFYYRMCTALGYDANKFESYYMLYSTQYHLFGGSRITDDKKKKLSKRAGCKNCHHLCTKALSYVRTYDIESNACRMCKYSSGYTNARKKQEDIVLRRMMDENYSYEKMPFINPGMAFWSCDRLARDYMIGDALVIPLNYYIYEYLWNCKGYGDRTKEQFLNDFVSYLKNAAQAGDTELVPLLRAEYSGELSSLISLKLEAIYGISIDYITDVMFEKSVSELQEMYQYIPPLPSLVGRPIKFDDGKREALDKASNENKTKPDGKMEVTSASYNLQPSNDTKNSKEDGPDTFVSDDKTRTDTSNADIPTAIDKIKEESNKDTLNSEETDAEPSYTDVRDLPENTNPEIYEVEPPLDIPEYAYECTAPYDAMPYEEEIYDGEIPLDMSDIYGFPAASPETDPAEYSPEFYDPQEFPEITTGEEIATEPVHIEKETPSEEASNAESLSAAANSKNQHAEKDQVIDSSASSKNKPPKSKVKKLPERLEKNAQSENSPVITEPGFSYRENITEFVSSGDIIHMERTDGRTICSEASCSNFICLLPAIWYDENGFVLYFSSSGKYYFYDLDLMGCSYFDTLLTNPPHDQIVCTFHSMACSDLLDNHGCSFKKVFPVDILLATIFHVDTFRDLLAHMSIKEISYATMPDYPKWYNNYAAKCTKEVLRKINLTSILYSVLAHSNHPEKVNEDLTDNVITSGYYQFDFRYKAGMEIHKIGCVITVCLPSGSLDTDYSPDTLLSRMVMMMNNLPHRYRVKAYILSIYQDTINFFFDGNEQLANQFYDIIMPAIQSLFLKAYNIPLSSHTYCISYGFWHNNI